MDGASPNVVIANNLAFDSFVECRTVTEQGARTILVVGDFDLSSKMLLQTLGLRGFTVFCATSPARGLALFLENRLQIDLAAIDAATFSSGNLDLAAELERLRPGLPVLYVVGARKTVVRSSIEAQAPGATLVAPFSEAQLVERIGGLLYAEYHAGDRLISAA